MSDSEAAQTASFEFKLWDLVLLLMTAWLARVAVIWILPAGAYSLDVRNFGIIVQELAAGNNPYKTTYFLNAPPFWMQILWVLAKVSEFSNLSLHRLIQVFLVLVESAVIIVLYFSGLKFRSSREVYRILNWSISLNPASVLLICQHSQFDPLVGLIVLGAVIFIARFSQGNCELDWLTAAFLVGAGILVKTVPLALIVLLAFGLGRLRWQALFIGGALLFGPVLVGLSVVYVMAPAEVTERVIEYGSVPGFFGVTGLIGLLGREEFFGTYHKIFFTVFLTILVVSTGLMRKLVRLPLELILAISVFLLALIAGFGPGFGHQYLYWFLPLLVLQYMVCGSEGRRVITFFLVIASLTYLVDYAFAASLGAFLKDYFGNSFLARLGGFISSPRGQTIVNLPLFAVWAGLVVWEGYLALLFLRRAMVCRAPYCKG